MAEAIEQRLADELRYHAESIEYPELLQELAAKIAKVRNAREDTLRKVAALFRDAVAGTAGELSDQSFRKEGGLRIIIVHVTEGMINQSLLTLTDARKAGLVSLGETFQVTLLGGETFTTTLIEPGSKFRERAMVRAFYERQQVQPGQKVLLKEVEPGKWILLGDAEASKETLDQYDL